MPKPGTLSLTLGAVLLASSASAQDTDAMRRQFMIPTPASAASSMGGPSGFFRGAPGTNTGTPLAFGPGMGDFFVGFSYENATRGYKQANGTFTANGLDNGSGSFGFGIGDADDMFGIETVVTAYSGTVPRGQWNRAAFSFQANRNITPHASIAVGVEDAAIAGAKSGEPTLRSVYGVASYVWLPKSGSIPKAITLSGGVGNGRFRLYDDAVKDRSTVNVFGSASVLFHEQFSGIVDWTGQDLNVGASLVPLKKFPLIITPAVVDITGSASGTARFVISAGIGMHYDFAK